MKNKNTVLITGASKGIGLELTKQFLELDYRVIAISRSNIQTKNLNRTKNLISIKHNVSEIKKHENILRVLDKNNIKQIDILINNAGLLINKPFEKTSYSEALSIFYTNFFAATFLIKSLLPKMRKSKKKSHIVNISSMGGFQGSSKFTGLSYYCASKAALAVFTECLAEELKDENISCNALALGAVQTEMLSLAFPNYKPLIKANEMATFIRDFAINAHSFINGKIIPVALTTP
ncbi:MAG: SDR family oxidoreductase [Bacteroidetes bacterium]|nr:SDR family oxidoreductase [Bacteroidota bacterium]MBV6460259.1 Fatty acyl-CoA reductase [Flavobacteriales bacterium]WKZ74627.1 MAG: SDR family oxidoreductase [Vicingaceae bacterium]MCL4815875.1 SDR family oxidoreductase [Flavobacteriales bacterium]NOG94934.1 SDR family oxidoreductase [Bacteroidota bacterium]